MTSISSEEAFLILGKWRDSNSHLQVGLYKPDARQTGSPGRILTCSPSDEIVSLSIVVNGQNAMWELPLKGASFEYGEPLDSAAFPEFAERVWSSYLLAKLVDGISVLFAERREWDGE